MEKRKPIKTSFNSSQFMQMLDAKKAPIFIFITVAVVIFSSIDDKTAQRATLVAPAAEEAYFANNVFADTQQQGKTVEDMVKRCEAAETALKPAAQPTPGTPPVANTADTKQLMEAGVCIGSIATFTKVKFPGKICLPSTPVALNQVIGDFLTWAQKNPAKLGFNYTVGYLEAFEEAFPCAKK